MLAQLIKIDLNIISYQQKIATRWRYHRKIQENTQKTMISPLFNRFHRWYGVVWVSKQAVDPVWSNGQGVRLANARSTVRILCSANAFELKRFEYHEPTTPGESCGSSTRLVPLNNCLQLMSQLACLRCKDQDRQPLVGGVWQSFLVRSTP